MVRNAVAPELLELLDAGSPGEVDFYSQYARHSGGPVLVLMCGTGRVALSIARHSVPVMALSHDAATIDLARRKASQAGVTNVMFVQGDPTHFVSESKHPLVIIPGGGLTQLLTLQEQKACLLAARATMQPGSKLVFDLPLLQPPAPLAAEPVMRKLGDRVALLRRQFRYDGARQLVEELVECHWLTPEGTETGSQYGQLQSRYVTPGEITLLLEACGMTVTMYGGFDREALLPGATRIVIETERNR